jgi:hypothetical protein
LKEIEPILARFTPVSLHDIEEVKLMRRIDRKYWFHLSKLPEILRQTLSDYYILEIEGQRLMDYQTTYFDTIDNEMYIKHHNGNRNRHKVRKRKYISTDSSFLEIKFKTNKKVTNKNRIGIEFEENEFLSEELEFIENKTPYSGDELHPILHNKFKRITLINKKKLDRCTIDIAPSFWDEDKSVKIDNMGIFELKRGINIKTSPIIKILQNLNIRQRGMSKYCTGRALLDDNLKQNSFKPRLRFIKEKIN